MSMQIDELLRAMVQKGASDLHAAIEARPRGRGCSPLRIVAARGEQEQQARQEVSHEPAS